MVVSSTIRGQTFVIYFNSGLLARRKDSAGRLSLRGTAGAGKMGDMVLHMRVMASCLWMPPSTSRKESDDTGHCNRPAPNGKH